MRPNFSARAFSHFHFEVLSFQRPSFAIIGSFDLFLPLVLAFFTRLPVSISDGSHSASEIQSDRAFSVHEPFMRKQKHESTAQPRESNDSSRRKFLIGCMGATAFVTLAMPALAADHAAPLDSPEGGNESIEINFCSISINNEQTNQQNTTYRKTNTMNQYHKLYTPADSVIVFIDQQPQMTFGMASSDRATMINNVTLLAKVAKEFNVPAILTAVETESFSGYIWPQLLDVFPGQPVIERTSMNSWDSMEFRKAIEATGRKNIIMTGLWTEVCITWPTIEMLGAGYNIYVVEDCCGATSPAAQEAALSRMVQAGAVRLTTIGALLEWQRDWKNKEHYNNLMGLLKQQGGAYGIGVEYAYTMVHHAPQSAQKPQVVPKKAAH